MDTQVHARKIAKEAGVGQKYVKLSETTQIAQANSNAGQHNCTSSIKPENLQASSKLSAAS